MRLQNRRALITGGSRGIGRAIALAYAAEGADIGVNYVRDDLAAQEVCEKIEAMGRRALPLRADVSQKQDVDRMVDEMERQLGPIDILVNNAALIDWVEFFDITEELWDRIVTTNLKGYFLCSQSVARRMKERGGGKILNVGSVAGYRATNTLILPYMASKGGIAMLSNGLAKILGPYGILVNTIVPATTVTDQNRDRLAAPGVKEDLEAKTPLGRLAIPEDVVGCAVFFASDESNYCVGATLAVDGGYGL